MSRLNYLRKESGTRAEITHRSIKKMFRSHLKNHSLLFAPVKSTIHLKTEKPVSHQIKPNK